MSGFESRSLHSATRRRSPPESLLTSASHGGRRRASAAISRGRSTSHPSAASIFVCSSPCRSRSSFISSSLMGSANFSAMALYSLSQPMTSPRPSSTLPRTSRDSSSAGSWGRKPTLMSFWARASPSNSVSSPAMILSRLDLPAPFKPSTPILAPGKNDREMFSRMVRFGGTVLVTPCMV